MDIDDHYDLERDDAQQQEELEDAFSKWIYENYIVWNGERLIELMEDSDVGDKFLDAMGLPRETEIK